MKATLFRWTQLLLGPALLLAIWEFIARFGQIDPVFLPAPSVVFHSFFYLLTTAEFWGHIAASLGRVAAGYSLATVLGVGFGLLLGWFVRISGFVNPLVELFRPVSPISIIPLAILWFGIGEESKIFLISYATVFPILLSTMAGVRSTEPILIRAASALGASQARILWTVVIPAAMPFIYTGLRVSMGIAMIVIISSEMVASNRGIGWFILDSERVYKTDYMFVGIVTISLLSLLIDFALERSRNLLLPWWRDFSALTRTSQAPHSYAKSRWRI